MSFKKILNFVFGFEGNAFVFIAGLVMSLFLFGLVCIWVIALVYSGLSFVQFVNIFI
jgi:hypothetical protein